MIKIKDTNNNYKELIFLMAKKEDGTYKKVKQIISKTGSILYYQQNFVFEQTTFPFVFRSKFTYLNNYQIYGNTVNRVPMGQLIKQGEYAGKYKISFVLNDNIINFYLPYPLGDAEYIDYFNQRQYLADGTSISVKLPRISSLNIDGLNILTMGTLIKPSKIIMVGNTEHAAAASKVIDTTTDIIGLAYNGTTGNNPMINTTNEINNYKGFWFECQAGKTYKLSRASNSTNRFSLGFTATKGSSASLLSFTTPLNTSALSVTAIAPKEANYICAYLTNIGDTVDETLGLILTKMD